VRVSVCVLLITSSSPNVCQLVSLLSVVLSIKWLSIEPQRQPTHILSSLLFLLILWLCTSLLLLLQLLLLRFLPLIDLAGHWVWRFPDNTHHHRPYATENVVLGKRFQRCCQHKNFWKHQPFTHCNLFDPNPPPPENHITPMPSSFYLSFRCWPSQPKIMQHKLKIKQTPNAKQIFMR